MSCTGFMEGIELVLARQWLVLFIRDRWMKGHVTLRRGQPMLGLIMT